MTYTTTKTSYSLLVKNILNYNLKGKKIHIWEKNLNVFHFEIYAKYPLLGLDCHVCQ